MNRDGQLTIPAEWNDLDESVVAIHRLEPQYRDLADQHAAAQLGIWIFLATEVMLFGTLFVSLGVYRSLYPMPFEKASERLNWIVGGANTIVLLVSSFFMALAVHHAQLGNKRLLIRCLGITALLGILFLCFKAFEYYTDYRDNLIPGVKFDDNEWVVKKGLQPEQVPHVKLFLLFYWFMTGLHALHVTIGICVVLAMMALARRGRFSSVYYAPVDVAGLYWHFVDVVWIVLLPMLYLLGTHTIADFHLF